MFGYLGAACNYDLLFGTQDMGHYENRSIPDCGMSILCDAHNHQLPNADAGIDGDDILVVGKEGIDVDLLNLRGEAEEGGETHDDLRILLFVDAFLPARTFYYFIAA